MNLTVLQYNYRPPHVHPSLVAYHPYRQPSGNERRYVSAFVSFNLVIAVSVHSLTFEGQCRSVRKRIEKVT